MKYNLKRKLLNKFQIHISSKVTKKMTKDNNLNNLISIGLVWFMMINPLILKVKFLMGKLKLNTTLNLKRNFKIITNFNKNHILYYYW